MAISALHADVAAARRPFVIAAYRAGIGPALPCRCIEPFRSAAPCRLRLDHYRPRKTGPGFAVAVIRCAAHRVAFTLYPPGHVPHGRAAIAPVSTSGEPLHAGDRVEFDGQVDWRVTVFDAVLDASEGRAWSRRPSATIAASWRTQGRRISLCASLLGLLSMSETTIQHAHALGIAPLALSDASRAHAVAGGYRARGVSIRRALDAVPISRRIADRLLHAGSIAGLWGEPFRCDARSGDLVSLTHPGRAPP